jgi:hypothetical protein
MAMMKPEETLLGVNRGVRAKPIVRPQATLIPRKAPPKVDGQTEYVGTQRATEEQKPETVQAATASSREEFYRSKTRVERGDLTKQSRRELDGLYAAYLADFETQKQSYVKSVGEYNTAIGVDPNPADTNARIRARLGVKPTATVLTR